MDYGQILKDIKPTKKEQEDIDAMTRKLVNFLTETCQNENPTLTYSWHFHWMSVRIF